MDQAKNLRVSRYTTRGAWNFAAVTFALALWGINSLARAEERDEHQILDASSLTCGEFGRLSLPRALVAVGWIGGFYAGLKNDTKVDILVFLDTAERVIAFCRENESVRVMVAVEQELRSNHKLSPAPSPTTPSR